MAEFSILTQVLNSQSINFSEKPLPLVRPSEVINLCKILKFNFNYLSVLLYQDRKKYSPS